MVEPDSAEPIFGGIASGAGAGPSVREVPDRRGRMQHVAVAAVNASGRDVRGAVTVGGLCWRSCARSGGTGRSRGGAATCQWVRAR